MMHLNVPSQTRHAGHRACPEPTHSDFLSKMETEFSFLDMLTIDEMGTEIVSTSSFGRPSITSVVSTISSRHNSMASVQSLSTPSSSPRRDPMALHSKRSPAARTRSQSSNTSLNLGKHLSLDLPLDVLVRIFNHLQPDGQNGMKLDHAGCLRNLRNAALVCSNWNRGTKVHMYQTIRIASDDLIPQRKIFRIRRTSRFRCLKRTLTDQPTLSGLVNEIILLDFNENLTARDAVELSKNLASIVLECSNLQRLTGYSAPYQHDFEPTFQALSTRSGITQHLWRVGLNAGRLKSRVVGREASQNENSLSIHQINSFIDIHTQWTHLETLFISCENGGVFQSRDHLSGIFNALPSLKNLFLSSFLASSFDDSHLALLPEKLESLRLQNLRGVTEEGIMDHFTRSESFNVRKTLQALTLINLNIGSVWSLSSLLKHLHSLRRLTFLAKTLKIKPILPSEAILEPALASRSLEYLHWDITEATSPNALLADSIRAGGFPSLKKLRAPFDLNGMLQSVCRPFTRASHSGPIASTMLRQNFVARGWCTACKPSPINMILPKCNPRSLSHARDAAYDRSALALSRTRIVSRDQELCKSGLSDPGLVASSILEKAGELHWVESSYADAPLIIMVISPFNTFVESCIPSSFLGTIGPNVPEYVLEADVKGSDEMLITIEHLMADQGATSGRELFEKFF